MFIKYLAYNKYKFNKKLIHIDSIEIGCEYLKYDASDIFSFAIFSHANMNIEHFRNVCHQLLPCSRTPM